MSARRCLAHGNFPVTYLACPVCGESCDWMQNAEPDDDWERAVEVAKQAPLPVTADDRIGMWRLERFLGLGYPIETAESLAISDADWHLADRLIRAGCPLPVAARIV